MLAYSTAVVEALDLLTTRHLTQRRDSSVRRGDDLDLYLEALNDSTGYADRRDAWWGVHGPSVRTSLAHWNREEYRTREVINLTLTAFMAADDHLAPGGSLNTEHHSVDVVVATVARALVFLAGADRLYAGMALA